MTQSPPAAAPPAAAAPPRVRAAAALLRKECHEHGIAVLVTAAVSAAVYLLLLIAGLAQDEVPLEVLRRWLLFFVPLVTWYLGGRLVRREYGSGTQLFLDALPLRRSSVVTAKYVTGGAALGLLVGAAFLVALAATTRRQEVTARLVAVVGARTAAYCWFLHAACFVLGFLGRYRAPALIVAVFAGALVAVRTDMDLSESGPWALLDSTYAFERNDVPWRELAGTLALVALLTALAYGLAAVREGSVAAALAHQMSHRERGFVGVVVLAAVFGLFVWDARREKKPFAPPAAADVHGDGARVVVGEGSELGSLDADALARAVHGRIVTLRRDLGIGELPPVFLFTRRGLDEDRFELGSLEDEAGLVVRIAPPEEGWDRRAFDGWLAWVLVREHTHGRAAIERRRWVLDAFAECVAEGAALDAPLDADRHRLLRALHGTPQGIGRDVLDRWLSFCEAVGDDVAEAVAWSGVRAMARTHGVAKTKAFLADALGREPPDDFRGLSFEREHALPVLVERHLGTTYDAFVRDWDAQLARERPALAAELAAIPRVTASLRVDAVSDGSREVDFTAFLAPRPDPSSQVRFRWTSVGPFDGEVWDGDLTAEVVPLAEAESGRRVPRTFRRGERIVWQVTHRVEALGCHVVSPLRRSVLE